MDSRREMIVDIFAGGGGASLGISQALGVDVDLAINHDEAAMAMHWMNHPHTRHDCADIYDVDPARATGGRPVGLMWASPDCTHHSRAKGGKPREKKIRSLAWVVVKWAAAVRPRVIILENVPEFREWGPLTKKNQPDKRRQGDTFRLWCEQLRSLGYDLQSRELRACDYGAPTIRKRLFVIARCDGQPIVWPEATHGPGRLPYRTAADCIDWSIPCPSIFLDPQEAKQWGVHRPLAEKTLERIARGVRKFVLEAREPFIVRCAHGETCQSGRGRWGLSEHSLAKPLPTVTGSKDFALVMPSVVGIDHKSSNGSFNAATPLRTITQKNRFALVAAFLQKYFSGVIGADLREPAPTVTAVDHNALVTSHLTKFYGTTTGSGADKPVPTITGGGQHIGEVRAFLLKYYKPAIGQDCGEPLHTVTDKARFGLVTVEGQQYQIADIGLRMLTPRELARAQGFPEEYILTGSKSNQVSKIGNSVCPPIAAALVGANVELHALPERVEEIA